MTLSLIIPTKDRTEDLLITLHSLLEQTLLPEEVIIVDQSQNNSRGKILEIMQGKSTMLKYIWDKEISGQTEARVMGLKEANGDIVFFLDDDVTLEKYCIENLIRTYEENPHVGGLCAVDIATENMSLLKLLMTGLFFCGPFSGKNGGWFYTDLLIHRFHKKRKDIYYTWAFFGGFMSFKRKVVEETGFDERLKGRVFAEDIDLAFRASKKYPLALAPSVKVLHREGRALYSPKWAFERRVFAQWYFFLKNINKTPVNILCFFWGLLGLMISAATASISLRSLEPIRGFFSAIWVASVGNSTSLPLRTILNDRKKPTY